MIKHIYILLIATAFLVLVSCADEHASESHNAPSQLRFSLAIADSEAGTRATPLPGDPGNPEWPFVKPKHLYAIAVVNYDNGTPDNTSDDETYLTYRHLDTSADSDWSNLHMVGSSVNIPEGTNSTYIPSGDSISTYNKGSLSLRSTPSSTKATSGKFYALATLAPIDFAVAGVTDEDKATDITSIISASSYNRDIETFIKSLTFSLPDEATLKAAAASASSVLGASGSEPSPYNAFFRSAYNTPSAGYPIIIEDNEHNELAVKTVTATLYHTATRLDIQWDTQATAGSGPVFGGTAAVSTVSTIAVTSLPTTGIHAFTPQDNTTSTPTYTETIITNPSTTIRGREVLYVPALSQYTMKINGNINYTTPTGTALPNTFTKAPWVRINLK